MQYYKPQPVNTANYGTDEQWNEYSADMILVFMNYGQKSKGKGTGKGYGKQTYVKGNGKGKGKENVEC